MSVQVNEAKGTVSVLGTTGTFKFSKNTLTIKLKDVGYHDAMKLVESLPPGIPMVLHGAPVVKTVETKPAENGVSIQTVTEAPIFDKEVVAVPTPLVVASKELQEDLIKANLFWVDKSTPDIPSAAPALQLEVPNLNVPEEIPDSVAKTTALRTVADFLFEKGFNSKESMLYACQQLKEKIPILKDMNDSSMEKRIGMQLARLQG